MKNTKLKNTKGITLIALVITIIVLLILAGVSIATLIGENGILIKAEDAKKNTAKEEAREKIQLEMLASFDNTGTYKVDIAIEKLEKNLGLSVSSGDVENKGDGTLKVKFNKYEFTVDIKGRVEDYINILDYVQVGQYVAYEPTKTDINKKQDVDLTKLTYTSPVGGYSSTAGIITHGNGKSAQKFTAKANDGTATGLKWRVLSVSEDKVELISDSVVKTDAATNFILKGGIGYLYAEQELNEACKIYGYGYGADTSVGATYTVGGPEDKQKTEVIEGTGARSITIEDLNKIASITEEDFKTLNSYYGIETKPTTAACYPTLNSSNTSNPGQSTSTKTGFKQTWYSWSKSKIEDTNIQDMVFNGDYWLASRCINTGTSYLGFRARYVKAADTTSAGDLCNGISALGQHERDEFGIRPIVALKSSVINTNTDYKKEQEWKLK